jgi:Rad3-related DNA helicase
MIARRLRLAHTSPLVSLCHQLTSRPELKVGGSHAIWDIEEFTTFARKHGGGCPYFAARMIAEQPDTELVLCPYNYLMDPMISAALGIDLTDAIVILDEAHNAEDISRSAASREVELSDIRMAEIELSRMIGVLPDESDRRGDFVTLRDLTSRLILWMQSNMPALGGKAASKYARDEEQITSVDISHRRFGRECAAQRVGPDLM